MLRVILSLIASFVLVTDGARLGMTVTATDGVLSGGKWVGSFTSQLQQNVVDALFAPVSNADWRDVTIVNASTLRYLDLHGDYQADVPLRLPSLFVLRLNGSLVDAANFTVSAHNQRFSGMVEMNQTAYSAVIGGLYNATRHNETQTQAVTVVNGWRNAIRNIRALSHFDSVVGINGGMDNEISGCELGGEQGQPVPFRAVWCLSTTRALVHDNHIHHSNKHALDFDAFTSHSVAHNNLCEDNAEEGIFVEETAHNNVITSNICRRNRNGIGVYSNAVGPVANNVIVGNTVTNNIGDGITAGGVGHDPTKHSDSNLFVANRAHDNTQSAFTPSHGATENDYWVGNTADRAPVFGRTSGENRNASVFDP